MRGPTSSLPPCRLLWAGWTMCCPCSHPAQGCRLRAAALSLCAASLHCAPCHRHAGCAGSASFASNARTSHTCFLRLLLLLRTASLPSGRSALCWLAEGVVCVLLPMLWPCRALGGLLEASACQDAEISAATSAALRRNPASVCCTLASREGGHAGQMLQAGRSWLSGSCLGRT